LFDQLEVVGRGGLIQARVLKLKKAVKGDANAREVSDALPFLGTVKSNQQLNILTILRCHPFGLCFLIFT